MIKEARITVRRRTMSLNNEATSWLVTYLNSVLQLRAHKNLTLEKAKRAEDRVRCLAPPRRLALGVVRRIQVAAVQTVAF